MNRKSLIDPLPQQDNENDEDFIPSNEKRKMGDQISIDRNRYPLRNDRDNFEAHPVRRTRQVMVDYNEDSSSEFRQTTLAKYQNQSQSEKADQTVDTFFEESLRYFEYSLDRVKSYWTIPLKRIIDADTQLRILSLAFPSGWKHRYRFQANFEKDIYGISKMFIGVEAVLDENEKNNPEWSRDVRLDFRITLKLGSMDTDKGFNKIFNAKNIDCLIQVPMKTTKEINLLLNDCIIVECSIRENKSLKNESSEYLGLINSGNLCYMNSVIQTLFHITEFQRLIFQMPSSDPQESSALIAALQKIFYNLRYSKKPVSTTELIKSFGWDKREANVQQDVQEFCLLFMEALEKKMDAVKGFQGRTSQLFEGKSLNYLRCLDVPYKSERVEKFIEIQLMVKDMSSIYESLDAYVQEEFLDEENRIDTDDYGKQNAAKGLKFVSLPPVMMIQLKRFEFDYTKGNMVKISDHCEYFDEIDMAKYLLPPVKSETRYKLFSVLVHNGGGASSGHYYSFIRPKPDGAWYKFNDDIVDLSESEEVFENNFGGVHTEAKLNNRKEIEATDASNLATAYMLVYIRVDKINEILRPISDNEVSNTLISEIIANKKIEEEKRKKNEEFIKIYISSFELLKDVNTPGLFFYKTGPKDDQYLKNFIKNKSRRLKVYIKRSAKVHDLIQFISDQTRIPVDEIMIWKINIKDEQISPVSNKKYLITPTNLNLLCNQVSHQQTKAIFFVHSMSKPNYPTIFKVTEPHKSEFFGVSCKNAVEFANYQLEQDALDIPNDKNIPIETRILERAGEELRQAMEEKRYLVILKAYSCKSSQPTIRMWSYMWIRIDYTLKDIIEELEKNYQRSFNDYIFYREEKKTYTLEKLEDDSRVDDGSADFGFVIVAELLKGRGDDYVTALDWYSYLSRRVWVSIIIPTKEPTRILVDGSMTGRELIAQISNDITKGEIPQNKILLRAKKNGVSAPSAIPVSDYQRITVSDLIKFDERVHVEISKIETDMLDKKLQLQLSYYSINTNHLTPEEEIIIDRDALVKELVEEVEKRGLFSEERGIDMSLLKEPSTYRIIVLEKKRNVIYGRANMDAKIEDVLPTYRLRIEPLPLIYEDKNLSERYYPIYGVQMTRDGEIFSNPFILFTKKSTTGTKFRERMYELMSKWKIDCLGKEIKVTQESLSKLRFILKVDSKDENYVPIDNDDFRPFEALDEGNAKKFALEIIHPFPITAFSSKPTQMQIRA